MQIGESKYGKFMLELAVHARVSLVDAVKISVSSMVSTSRANLGVGPPYDLAIYRNGALSLVEHRIEPNSPYLAELQQAWINALVNAIDDLPHLPDGLLDD